MKLISKIILIIILFFSWNFNSADLNFKTEIQAETLSDWYDADWNYRKSVNISGSPSVLADFQVLMAIDTAVLMSDGKMSLDCSDLRFTDSDGKTELNYWIESGCNSPDTKVWVNVPFIPISGIAIYMYYGNSSAQSVSNGEKTFDFFDDFKDGSDKWTGSGQEYSTLNTGYVYASESGFNETSSNLISNIIGTGDFKLCLKIKNEGTKTNDDCEYKHELKLINDGEETVLDSSADYSEFTKRIYRISGNNLKLKFGVYVKGCESADTEIKCTRGDHCGVCSTCKCSGNECPSLPAHDSTAPSCSAGYEEIDYYCKETTYRDPHYNCTGTDCKECRKCQSASLSVEAKAWIDDVYVYKYISSEPIIIIGTEKKNDGSFSSADLNCDGKVNLTDSAILMSFWGKDPSGAISCQSPDIDQDGDIDLADFGIMMSQWTTLL
jgi:hypothetical protein